jgi:predicted transcriptional regulator
MLFVDKTEVLLRWNNVYYRKPNFHNMLTAPGRILWYVSAPDKQIIAVSCFDEVVIDTAKELFRKFKKFGILEWQDLYEMCGGDPLKELMALKFSHTFLFPNPILLAVVRTVFNEDGVGLSLQGPSVLPPQVFHELFQKGYSN